MENTLNGMQENTSGSLDVKRLVKSDIASRMAHRIPAALFKRLGIKSPVRIAGSSCNSDIPNDIDVYPSVENQFGHSFREEIIKKNCSDIRILNASSNALTVRYDAYPYPVQFCSYMHKSLSGLIESFDFSHVQVGIEVSYSDGEYSISDVQFTNAYVNYLLTRKSRYMGSDYPLSSLIRTLKYYKRGYLDKFDSKLAIISILTSILDRGFSDYDDFKDQLSAIDLFLLEDDDHGELRRVALDLYDRLRKNT